MRRLTELLVVAALAAVTVPAPASVFGSKKPAVNPEQRLAELIATAQTATDATLRCDAVEALREYSAAAYPHIVPVLVDVLHQDKSIAVRVEAARSLGRVRPLTKMAGDALSEAAQKDSALRVRWQARASLTCFTVAGINPHNHGGADTGAVKVINGPNDPNVVAPGQVLVPGPGANAIYPGGNPPSSTTSYSLPMPKGPTQVPVVTPEPTPPAPTPAPAPFPPQTAPSAVAPMPSAAPPAVTPPVMQPPLPTAPTPPATPAGTLTPGAVGVPPVPPVAIPAPPAVPVPQSGSPF